MQIKRNCLTSRPNIMDSLHPCLKISSLNRVMKNSISGSVFTKKSSEMQLTPHRDSRNLLTPYTSKTHRPNFSQSSMQTATIFEKSDIGFNPGNVLRHTPIYKLEGTETSRKLFMIKSYCVQPSLMKNKIITKELYPRRSVDGKLDVNHGNGHTFGAKMLKEQFRIPTKVIRFGEKILKSKKKDAEVNAVLTSNEGHMPSHNHSSSVNFLVKTQSSSLLSYSKSKKILNLP